MKECKYHCKNGKIFMESLGTFVDCPDCRNITKVLEKPEDDGVSIYDKLKIPPAYKNLGVIGQELLSSKDMAKYSTTSINEIANILERINGDIYAGVVTNISCYIHVPNNIDIKQFVYGAQKLAIERGLGVVPFVSANTLYGLQRVGDYTIKSLKEIDLKKEYANYPPDIFHVVDGYRFIEYTNLTYFDFIHADICFVDATANTTDKGWTGVADLLSERSKEGLPTYIIGYWPSWTSSSIKNSTGLRYLLANQTSVPRLDLLVPFELKGKTSASEDETADVTRLMAYGNTNSNITAGLTAKTFMES